MNNSQIAEVFENIAGLLQMREESSFTIRAYQKAARTIDRHPVELEQMVSDEENLQEISGIGKAISEKITELVNTGSLEYFERLKKEFPPGIFDLMNVPGLGPKTTVRVWKELGITTLDELEQGIADGRLASLPRMGKKSAENILRHIQYVRNKDTRMPIARALRISSQLVATLRESCPHIDRLVVAGSLRRFEETIGDIDLVCTSDSPSHVMDALVNLPNVADVLGRGDTKTSVLLNDGIQIDLRVVENSKFGSMLQHFTGSVDHNVQMRDHANRMGLSLSEYGVTNLSTGVIEDFADEESFYQRLGLQFVAPELRSGSGEIQDALESRIPVLLSESDIKGDLHLHTDWSDGRDPMDVMVAAAKERGLRYIAVTDHSVGRGIANGLSIDRLLNHMQSLETLQAQIGDIKLLRGTEMDIRADGSLDYPDEVLAQLDWVIGSIHSAMNQDSATMTARIIKAMQNPYVSVIGHLTTRLIGERQPIEADFEAIFRAALDTGTALEINASPERLDLKDTHIRRAREMGVPLVVNTDAHTFESLDNMQHGVANARRGWCEARHILNTLSTEDFMEYLKTPKPERTRMFSRHAI